MTGAVRQRWTAVAERLERWMALVLVLLASRIGIGAVFFQSGRTKVEGLLSVTDGAVMGTLGYMSPEQLLGQDVDHRTDIFAVGVMIAEALTGRRPFEGEGSGGFVQAALHGEYHLPHSSREAEVVDRVLQQCLAKDRADRFATAAELRQSLIPALRALAAPGF